MSSAPAGATQEELTAAEELLANYRSRLQAMDSDEFEEFVADLWSREGWDTCVTKGGGDRGIDVVGTQSRLTDRKLLLQAKRYGDGNNVEPRDIREYAGVRQREHDADEMALVTTSSLTQGAVEEAEELNVKVMDGDELAEKIAGGGHGDLVDEYEPQSGVNLQLRRVLGWPSRVFRPLAASSPVGLLKLTTISWLIALYLLYVGQATSGVTEVVFVATFLFGGG